MYKALIFDLDGTIADTIPVIQTALNETMRRFGYPEHDIPSVRSFINNGARQLVIRAMPESERTEEQIQLVFDAYQEAYTRAHLQTDTTYAGMDTAIATLRDRGYRIGVLSNKGDSMVKGLCAQLLPGLIEVAYGQREGYPTKPDPTVPLAVAAELDAEPHEVAFIGDSDVDIKTALAAGFAPIGVAWGYRPAQLLLEIGAKTVLPSPDALTEYFH